MKLRKYTEKQLREAIQSSVSIREALQKLNIKAAGGNYYIFQKAVNYFNIDTSHFTGQNITGRKLPQRRKSIEDYITNKIPIQSNKLRKYLLESGTFKHECSSCKLSEWMGNPIPIELDHINGNNQDNSLENLRILCPNCHALTPTYRGKNIAIKA
jgi:hypothetical protein